jgi:hypothetical protein
MFRIEKQHYSCNFAPVSTFRIRAEQAQIRDEVLLVVARYPRLAMKPNDRRGEIAGGMIALLPGCACAAAGEAKGPARLVLLQEPVVAHSVSPSRQLRVVRRS